MKGARRLPYGTPNLRSRNEVVQQIPAHFYKHVRALRVTWTLCFR